MTQSILAFYSENVWSKHHTRNTHKFIHWVLQAVGSLGAIAGMIIEFVARYQKSKTHFQSTHSILGLTAFILTILGMLNGVFAINAVKLKKYGRPLYFKFVHNLTGIAAFVIGMKLPKLPFPSVQFISNLCSVGMTCLYYGYDKNYMKFNSRPDIRMWLQALTIITILLSLIGALRSTLNFVRSIFNNWTHFL